MSSQSSPIAQELRRGKRPRSTIPITSSFLNDSGDDTCSACDRETDLISSSSSNNCITVDLTPSDYFRLALTITDPTAQLLKQADTGDYTTQYLIKNARRLAVDQELGLNVILMLHPLMANYYKEGVSKLIPVMKKTRLHKARELRFVQSCLGEVKSATFDLVMDQFQQCFRAPVDLGKIIMSDIRYARLLPLLCFLMDVSSGEAGEVVEINQNDSQSQTSQRVDAEDYLVIHDSDYDQLESSESIIDMTQEPYDFVIAPSLPDYSSYFSPSLNGGDQDLSTTLDSQGRAVDPFGPRHSSSQTSDRNMSFANTLNIPSPLSKDYSLSIIDPPSEISSRPSSSASQVLSSQTAMPSPQRPVHLATVSQQQQQKRLTDYEELSTAELKAKLKSFGFKTSNSRPQMIQDLKHIQATIDSQRNSQQRQSSTTSISSLQSLSDLNGNSQVSAVEPSKRMEIIQHLRSRPEIWQKIAMYNTVSIEECMVGIRCKRGEMKMVLDEFAAAKGTNKRHVSRK